MSAFEGKQISDHPLVEARPRDFTLIRVLASPVMSLGLLVVAVAQQMIGHLDCDVSWFITFAEKWLDGQSAYVDVTDPNPPAAFLSLAPAVLMARAIHMAVEPVVVALVFALAGLSVHFTGHALHHGRKTRSLEEWGAFRNGAIFLFLIVPEIAFAEREHIALLLLLPMLAVMAASAQGASLSRPMRLGAGLGAGLAICFKPHFALALFFPALAIAWRERSLGGLLRAEIWAIAAVSTLYGVAIVIFFPAYASDALPLIIDVYSPVRESWRNLALHTLLPVQLGLIAGFFIAAYRSHGAPLLAGVAAWASVGFLVSFLIQGKGWINHAYPGVALALFAWIIFTFEKRSHPIARGRLVKYLFAPALIAAPALHGGFVQWSNEEEHPGLRQAITSAAPAHPRLIAIARQMDLGHPLTRQLGGAWVGRQNALWVSSLVGQLLPAAREAYDRTRLLDYRHKDLLAFADDVEHGRPDAILVEDRAIRDWVLKQPETSGVLAGYSLTAEAGPVEIWTRKPD